MATYFNQPRGAKLIDLTPKADQIAEINNRIGNIEAALGIPDIEWWAEEMEREEV